MSGRRMLNPKQNVLVWDEKRDRDALPHPTTEWNGAMVRLSVVCIASSEQNHRQPAAL